MEREQVCKFLHEIVQISKFLHGKGKDEHKRMAEPCNVYPRQRNPSPEAFRTHGCGTNGCGSVMTFSKPGWQ